MNYKSLFVSVILFLVIAGNAISQDDPALPQEPPKVDIDSILKNLPEIFSTDNNLKLIARFLPETWKVRHADDSLIFYHPQPIFEMTDDLIEDPLKRSKSRFTDLKDPVSEQAVLVFVIEPLWSGSRMDDANSKNSFTHKQIEQLFSKYKITHLKEEILSPDFNIEAEHLSEMEVKSIKRYLEEKEMLMSDYIHTPDYHTSNYSLFLSHFYPQKHRFNRYTPPHIIEEIDLIISVFQQYAGK
jgi:hypothetical protein